MSTTSKYLPKADAFIKTLKWSPESEGMKLMESIVVGNIYGFAGYLDKQPFTEPSTQEALAILDEAAALPSERQDEAMQLIEWAIQKLRPVATPVHDAAALAQLEDLPRQALILGIPRLPDDCRREFLVRLEDGSHRRLWWLENYTLDSHGDEVKETGWHTCLPEEGYDNFFRKWKGTPVTHYLSEVPASVPAAPMVVAGRPSNPTTCSPLSCDGSECGGCQKRDEPRPTTPTELPMLEGGEGE